MSIASTSRYLTAAWLLLATTAWAAEPAAPKAKPPQQERTWISSAGTKVEATLVDVADGKAKLRKQDGTVIAVPLDRLSQADRDWLATQGFGPSPLAAYAGEWPCWLGPFRNGKSPDTGLLKEWGKGEPRPMWKFGELGAGFSSPVISRNTIYISGEMGGRLYLYALSLKGKVKWRMDHGPAWTKNTPGARGSAAIDGDRVYLLSGTGLLGCHDTKTGRLLWFRDSKDWGGKPGTWGYAESPLVWGNLVIFKPGGRTAIVALNKETGKDAWTASYSAWPEYGSCVPVVHDDVMMVVAGTRAGLVAVNAEDGKVLWHSNFGIVNTANIPTPIFSDGCVYWAIGYGKGGMCVKLGDKGQPSAGWTTKDMVCQQGGYVIHDGYVYGNHNNGWSCIEMRTGKKMWSEQGVGKGSICWADDMLYMFSEDGRCGLANCSPKGLEMKGEFKIDGEGASWAYPVVVGGRLYLRYGNVLSCYSVQAKEK
jgi:outer membrane protein assembly factor BamB